MAADALAHCITRLSTDMIFTVRDRFLCAFYETEFAWYQSRGTINKIQNHFFLFKSI